jgi:hypothetical protein
MSMSTIAPARRVQAASPEPVKPKQSSFRPRLVLASPRRKTASRAPFFILTGGLMVVGLVSVLLLHMMAAQDSFRATALQQHLSALTDREQQAEQQVAADTAPSALRARAIALGMVPTAMTHFRRLKDGRIVAVETPLYTSSTASHSSTSATKPTATTSTPTKPSTANSAKTKSTSTKSSHSSTATGKAVAGTATTRPGSSGHHRHHSRAGASG